MKNTIVLIHGMFQNPKSWKNWIAFFESKGYEVIAPAWPLHEGEPSVLREQVPLGLGDLELDTIITSIETLIYKLPEKPIVIGHSVGGLIVQLLVNRGLAKLGVAISSVAPNGMVTFDWSFVKNAATIANPLKGDEPIYMDEETFQGAFANTLSEAEAKLAFDETATHDSRNVFRDCMGSSAQLDVELPHVPLLFIAGEQDKICPADLNEKNAKAYTDVASVTEIQEFPNRSHFICNEPGWEEVATYINNWLDAQGVGTNDYITAS
ncbi:alpha/beta hydrolase [Pedobacter yonginense]|uniref:Alpha/beta hydrolase n=1 Tax=Pedobacter yonginense TaxID=651869 RepID=A0A317ERZ0_9SPHI|nr:alpha/beta hydrolase [Pedobacter yonginense]PWS29464.1 alpha/beta hydrolase [Pedobacter yonginense]